MRINTLKIQSFRGIRTLTLDFPATQTAVLIGDNGTGKTAILDCIASLFALMFPQEINNFEINGEDIQNESNETRNELEFSINNKTFPLGYTLRRQGPVFPIHHEWWQTSLGGMLQSSEDILPAIIVYYPVNRTLLNISLEAKQAYSFDRKLAFENALIRGTTDFQQFFEWFRMREDYENEIRLERDVIYRDKELEAVRTAIHTMLPEFSNPRIKRNPLQMIVMKGDEELRINQLSDGERGFITLCADIAKRLANANPDMANPLQGTGIVLIDEIELHLHPNWQRKAIPDLEKIFPNCQFIVTTHSPQVLSLVRPESIFVLEQTPEGIHAFHPQLSYGRDSNQILEEVMDAPERPQAIQDELKTYFRFITNGELENAKRLRKQLEAKIGEDEPEFVRADVILRRKELLKP